MNRTVLATLGAAGLLVTLTAACQPIEPTSAESFGNAVTQNMELQVVNPSPTHEAGPPALDGNRAGLAVGRYQSDQVKEPRDLRTTSSVGVMK
jgi:hypothetical protein